MKVKKTQFMLFFMLIWALIMQVTPTSTSPTVVSSAWIAYYTRAGLLFVLLFLVGTRRIVKKAALIQLCNIVCMFLFSWLTIRYRGFKEAYYNAFYYFFLACILVMDLRGLRISRYYNLLFYGLVVFFGILGILVILKIPAVCEFLSTYYTRHWDYSAYYMTRAGKPVGTYAVHSIAGFMYFQFALLLYYKNKKTTKWYNIALISLMAVLIAMLRSNSAVMFLGLGAMIILFDNREQLRFGSLVFRAAFIIAVCVFVIINMDSIQRITGSTENGLLGRFTGTSAFLSNLRFLASNLLPIGFTGSNSLWLSDNGYIVALIRGGIFNIAAMYGGVYYFLKRNVENKSARVSLLISIAAFEMAYPVLLEIRFLSFMPFLILYLNSCETASMRARGNYGKQNEGFSWNRII